MTNNGIVNIHGKEYMTVARRLEIAHEEHTLEGVETEVLSHDPIVIRATVKIKKKDDEKIFTGISSVNPESARLIERQNPYEVAETSAVGRALGFAGYGLIEAVASADDMVRAVTRQAKRGDSEEKTREQLKIEGRTCVVCGERAIERQGITKSGKAYHGIFCTTEEKRHTQWL